MKYFISTKFIEGSQKERFPFSLFRKETKPTIDLISIGIVAEDGREYYAISKDFNLKKAWNRLQISETESWGINDKRNNIYWVRENILNPIFEELVNKDLNYDKIRILEVINNFSFKYFKYLINKYGKTNKQISEEIKDFVSQKQLLKIGIDHYGFTSNALETHEGRIACIKHNFNQPEFYGYYSDYDWVAFCWLFGKMNDLPDGFPMYCIDLKQEMDRIEKSYNTKDSNLIFRAKDLPNYPKQTNEHNALEDARWNKKLYDFLQTI